MGLVDYSDSDTSDIEQHAVGKPSLVTPKSKGSFARVVDRSNPGKIKVSLPSITTDTTREEEPSAKRMRTSGPGVFGGFNSLLPPPKRNTVVGNATPTSKQVVRSGVASGFALKTGAAPGFERGTTSTVEEDATTDMLVSTTATQEGSSSESFRDVGIVGKATMFRPLSVARKPVKKKISKASSEMERQETAKGNVQEINVKPKAKVSLFSIATEDTSPKQHAAATMEEYKPLLFGEDHQGSESIEANGLDGYQDSNEQSAGGSTSSSGNGQNASVSSQSLFDIAGDLNLSAAQRRQLLGRQKPGMHEQRSAAKVINFNTDQEYLHNEQLRASGEQVVHNPVRAIAPGKHSLKQLVNAAQSQKDALEESFAKGKSNRAEASSRYGW